MKIRVVFLIILNNFLKLGKDNKGKERNQYARGNRVNFFIFALKVVFEIITAGKVTK